MSGELVLTSPKWGMHIGFQELLVATMNDWQPMMTGIFNYFPSGLNSATESPWHSQVLAENIQFLVQHELLRISDVDLTPGENISEVSQVLRTSVRSSAKRPGEAILMTGHRLSWPRDCHILGDTLLFCYQTTVSQRVTLSICNNTILNFN